jgi:16S rRNA (cytidine1402-2'-O)-methyltransferase
MNRSHAAVGRLAVCPTPIGNLKDVTLRVLETLREADVVACEDTRRARLLLQRHDLDRPLVSLHEHNERARSRELAARVRDGAVVALLSDAGTPVVSDPGFELVRACLREGLEVEVLPGASAVTTALVASGLPAERFCFVGFLPRKRSALQELLAGNANTLVAFESPRRVAATLALLAELDSDRPAAVCRELTKLHEEVRRGSAAELAAHYGGAQLRGEVVLVVGGAAGAPSASGTAAVTALAEVVAAGARARPAAAAIAKLSGRGANELYRELARGKQQPSAGAHR